MVRIRRATPADRHSVLRLWRHLQEVQGHIRPFHQSRDPDDVFLEVFDATVESEHTTWLVAETADGVVGMAELHLEKPSRVSDEHVLEISRVSVEPGARGAGIGRAIVAESERVARARGARFLSVKVFSANDGARRFWDAHEFVPFFEHRLRRLDGDPESGV